MTKLLTVLYALNEDANLSQRALAKKCELSIGSINGLIKEAVIKKYLVPVKNGGKLQYELTETGLNWLEIQFQKEKNRKINVHLTHKKSIDTAVILAAGKRPDFECPVAFLPINKMPLIERTLEILSAHNMKKIVIVTGYKSHYFHQLARKNPRIILIENKDYQHSGTMKSLATASGDIRGDFLLLESDIIFEEGAINCLLDHEARDCMIITNESGSKDEALVEIRDGYIYNMSKDIHQLNQIDGEMIGLSKVSYDVFQKMLQRFESNKNPYLNYEYMLMDIGRKYKIGFKKIADLLWYEIDTKAHYETFKNKIFRRLQDKEENVRSEVIKEQMVSALGIEARAIEQIELIGGMTNKNYKVKVTNEDYILRIPGSGTADMINRQDEYANCMQANGLGLDANIIYLNQQTGLKIATFINGAETLNSAMAKRDDVMTEIVKLMRKLHQSKITFENDFNPFEEIKKYDRLNQEANGFFPTDYEVVKEQVLKLEHLLQQLDPVAVASHNDTVPENFIRDANGRFYLVDWEYSGNNDPMWDLGAHALECGFDLEEEMLLLKKYLNVATVEAKYREKMLIFQICQDFLWSIWTWIKEAKGDDFGDYGMNRYDRAKSNLERIGRFEKI